MKPLVHIGLRTRIPSYWRFRTKGFLIRFLHELGGAQANAGVYRGEPEPRSQGLGQEAGGWNVGVVIPRDFLWAPTMGPYLL